MRWTPQRRTIVEVLSSASGHLTGPELIERCRSAHPTTIPSTVYRTLDVLEELGLVRHGHSADGREEFHVAQEPEHGHLYCATCGGRWEVGSAQAQGGCHACLSCSGEALARITTRAGRAGSRTPPLYR